MTRAYDRAQTAGVGVEIACPACGVRHRKKTYNHVFCTPSGDGRACKDLFWNTMRPAERKQRNHDAAPGQATTRAALLQVVTEELARQGCGVLTRAATLRITGPVELDVAGLVDAILAAPIERWAEEPAQRSSAPRDVTAARARAAGCARHEPR